jgi:MFS family permease
LFCAPTITATIDTLSRVVPTSVRGEAMGWHGSAMTIGSAVGAPAIGFVLDRASWHGGFVTAGAIGVLVGVAGWATISVRRSRRAKASGEQQQSADRSAGHSLQAGVPPGS